MPAVMLLVRDDGVSFLPTDVEGPFSGELDSTRRSQQLAFVTLQIIGGHILLPILLLTFVLAKNLRRHRRPPLFSFFLSFVMSSVAHNLLFYSGYLNADGLPRGWCILQATAIGSVQILTSLTTMGLLFHVWLRARAEYNHEVGWNRFEYITVLVPYFVALAFGLSVGISAMYSREISATRGLFYCTMATSPEASFYIRNTIDVSIAVIFALSAIVIGLLLYIIYCRRREIARQNTISFSEVHPTIKDPWRVPAHLAVRVAIFIAWTIVIKIAIALAVMRSQGVDNTAFYQWTYHFVAATPLAVFLVFGTQMDILRVWFPCIRFGQEEPPPMPPATPLAADFQVGHGPYRIATKSITPVVQKHPNGGRMFMLPNFSWEQYASSSLTTSRSTSVDHHSTAAPSVAPSQIGMPPGVDLATIRGLYTHPAGGTGLDRPDNRI